MLFYKKEKKTEPSPNFHLGGYQLIPDKPHEIYLANTYNPDTLIIFVHGFNGRASMTWNQFPSLMIFNPVYSRSDIVFYGYDSFKYQASDLAAIFCDFINKDLMTESSILQKLVESKNLQPRSYDKIYFVAHSLGAIIIREALLRANNLKYKWIDKTRISLFAPAHLGAKIDALVSETLSLFTLTKLISILAEHKIPVLSDLKQGSVILQKIKSDTENLLSKDEGKFLKAIYVGHAPGDKVVLNGRFVDDNEAIIHEGQSHTSICKPNPPYVSPIEALTSLVVTNQ
jgi:hypothetical protein